MEGMASDTVRQGEREQHVYTYMIKSRGTTPYSVKDWPSALDGKQSPNAQEEVLAAIPDLTSCTEMTGSGALHIMHVYMNMCMHR